MMLNYFLLFMCLFSLKVKKQVNNPKSKGIWHVLKYVPLRINNKLFQVAILCLNAILSRLYQ
jgi:hypothetical protein